MQRKRNRLAVSELRQARGIESALTQELRNAEPDAFPRRTDSDAGGNVLFRAGCFRRGGDFSTFSLFHLTRRKLAILLELFRRNWRAVSLDQTEDVLVAACGLDGIRFELSDLLNHFAFGADLARDAPLDVGEFHQPLMHGRAIVIAGADQRWDIERFQVRSLLARRCGWLALLRPRRSIPKRAQTKTQDKR
jgi:hypothetical protein